MAGWVVMGTGDPAAPPGMAAPAGLEVFVSYAGADEAWATWVAEVLEAEGRGVAIQVWDAVAGMNFVAWISERMAAARWTVAICSRAYFASHWRTQEWTGALAGSTLIPLRVEDCPLPPMLATLTCRDLHGVDEPTARRRLVEAVGLARPPRRSGGFPGHPAAPPPPATAPSLAVPSLAPLPLSVPVPVPVPVVFPGQAPRSPARPAGERVRIGMPPRVADHFQYRPAADELDRHATGGATAASCQVLAGMGGVGKTQLAAHRAERMWRAGEIDLLVWVVATSRETVQTSYARAAAKVCGADPADPAAAAETLLGWLADTDRRWLVVLDDLAEPADLAGLWPPTTGVGEVLVTTRRRDAALIGPGRRRLDVGLFTPAQATAYLTAALASHQRTDGPAQIAALAADLGWLPLALSQAAAYVIDLDLDCAAYRHRLADRGRTLADLAPDSGLPDDQQTTIAAAWVLSLDRANQLRPAGLARPLLELAALLDPNGFPDTVLTSPAALAHLATVRPGQPAPSADDARDAIRALHRLSLVDHTPTHIVRVHQLLQRAIRDTLTPERTGALTRAAADALLAVWPETDPDGTHTQILRANTTTLRAATGELLLRPDVHPVLVRLGRSLGETGLIAAATDHYQQLHQLAHQHLGADHPDTLTARGHLVRWRGQAGDPAGAAAATEALLADQARVLGPDHPDILITRNNLAAWRGQAGDPAGAAAATEALLADSLRTLGPDHPATLTTRHNLAHWRGQAGDPAGAAAATEALLADYVRVVGPDHPSTLASRHDLAHWHGQAGDPAGAATATETLLADRTRVLGPDHPDTLRTRNNLAHWRGQAGDHAGATAAFETLLGDQTRVLGPDHPDTLTTRHNLADRKGHSGDPAGAAAAFETLLDDRSRALGPDHPDTLATRHHLGRHRGEAGDPAGAAEIFAALLIDHTRVLGPDHADTLTTRNNLAHWRGEAGDPAGAAAAFRTLLGDRTRVLGPDHPHTLVTHQNLASWCGRAGDIAGTLATYEALAEAFPRALGADHPDTLTTRNNLAFWRGKAGDPAGAAAAFAALLADRTRVLGPDHPDTLVTRHNLAFWQAEADDVPSALRPADPEPGAGR